MFGIVIRGAYWAIRSPWIPRYFHERNGAIKIYPLGFGWRITSQPRGGPMHPYPQMPQCPICLMRRTVNCGHGLCPLGK
jgi:hypothetical protein